MKIVFFSFVLLCAVVFSACKSEQIVMDNSSSADLLVGVVHVDGECSIYITVIIDGTEIKVYPANLPTQFRKEGLKIKFISAPSRAPQPVGCFVDKVISVEQVEKLK
jgi:hypothetical protein